MSQKNTDYLLPAIYLLVVWMFVNSTWRFFGDLISNMFGLSNQPNFYEVGNIFRIILPSQAALPYVFMVGMLSGWVYYKYIDRI